MKNHEFPIRIPKVGRYVKLIKTREIVENIGFNPKTLTVDVKSKTGVTSVGLNEIAEISANEELEFISSQQKIFKS